MKRTILIADNDAAARTNLQNILTPEGHDILHAESGEQALAMATAVSIDLFLLRVDMPRMNGIIACRELRAIEQYCLTPIIFLAGSSGDASLAQALTTGGDDFIHQPYTPVTVNARLKLH